MEELLQQQQELIYSLERALVNFKKTAKGRLTVPAIRQRISLLKEKFAQCELNHARLLHSTIKEFREQEKYFTEDHFLDCEEAFFEALDFMTDTLAKQILPAAETSMDTSTESTATTHGTRSTPSLPKISLPKFSGDFLDWETFRDHFKSVIIENTDLSEVTRMHYLLSCLKGEASDLVRTLPITEANFQVAWRTISARYDNERRLVHEHTYALHSLPNVHSESAAELTSLRDKASMAIQALRNLNRPVDQADDFLIYLISQRLDKSTRKAWELHLGDTTTCPKYDALEQFLAARIRAFENILPSTSTNRKSNTKSVVQSHTANTLKCPVCKQNHLLSACSEFKTQSVKQRRELVNKLHRCFNCLSHKHTRKECRSKYACRVCQKPHHSLLHEEADTPTPNTIESTASAFITSEIANVSSH